MTQVDRSADGPTTEKRTTRRIGVELWAEECCGADVYFHRVTNISRDGFFIEKKLPFQAGTDRSYPFGSPGRPKQAVHPVTRGRQLPRPARQFARRRISVLDMDAQTREGIAAYIDRMDAEE
jgi:hypothetical protein